MMRAKKKQLYARLAALGYETIADFQHANNIRVTGRMCHVTKRVLRGNYAVSKSVAERMRTNAETP